MSEETMQVPQPVEPRPLHELMPEIEKVLNDEQLAALGRFAARAGLAQQRLKAAYEHNHELTESLMMTGNFLAALVKRQGGRLRIRPSEVEVAEETGKLEVQRRVSCSKDADGSYVLQLVEVSDGEETLSAASGAAAEVAADAAAEVASPLVLPGGEGHSSN